MIMAGDKPLWRGSVIVGSNPTPSADLRFQRLTDRPPRTVGAGLAYLRHSRAIRGDMTTDRDQGAPAAGTRARLYFYCLRDELPLQSNWLVTAHERRDDGTWRNYRTGFLSTTVSDAGLDQAFDALNDAVDKVRGSTGDPRPTRKPAGGERRLFTAVVSAEVKDGEDLAVHQRDCFERLRGVMRGLRLATKAPVHDLTIERVWPVYLIGHQEGEGPIEITNIVIVEHGFTATPIADASQLQEAVRLADAGYAGNPVETYRHFEHDAEIAAWHDGDYSAAVLNAAIATEVLIKHSGWLLTWEATTQLEQDPQPDAVPDDMFGLRPSQMIGRVLAPRLGGNWDSHNVASPVGEWRERVARLRNSTVHLGGRPREEDAKLAVQAINHLESHILDRLASAATSYPRTALLLAGRPGLNDAGAGKLLSRWRNCTRTEHCSVTTSPGSVSVMPQWLTRNCAPVLAPRESFVWQFLRRACRPSAVTRHGRADGWQSYRATPDGPTPPNFDIPVLDMSTRLSD